MDLNDLQYHHRVIEKQYQALRSPKWDSVQENKDEIEENIVVCDTPVNTKNIKREKSDPNSGYFTKMDMNPVSRNELEDDASDKKILSTAQIWKEEPQLQFP